MNIYIDNIAKWRVDKYTFSDNQLDVRSISMTVTHPSSWIGEDAPAVADFTGAYVLYKGERFELTVSSPTAEKNTSSIDYKYELIFKGVEEELSRRKVRDLAKIGESNFVAQGTSFILSGDAQQFTQLIENNLKYYFNGDWTISLLENPGDDLYSFAKIAVDNMSIWELLGKTYEYYGLRWKIKNKEIIIGYTPEVVEHIFDYGKDGGLVKITRTKQDENTINRLIAVGGSRNIPLNYFTDRYDKFPKDPNPISSVVNIRNLMPKVFRDSVKAGAPPYIDYVEDSVLVAKDGVRESIESPNEDIYPSISKVEVADIGRIDQIVASEIPTTDSSSDNGYSQTFDIWIKDIGFDLIDDKYTSTQDAKISFTSGELAGYEFTILATGGVRHVSEDTSKSHNGVQSKYRITLIKSDEDYDATGRMLPNTVLYPKVYADGSADSFVIYDIEMPQVYVELAEERLEAWMNERLDKLKIEKPTYAIEIMDSFFATATIESDNKKIEDKIIAGNKVKINNTNVTNGVQELFISNVKVDYKGILPKYFITITDKLGEDRGVISKIENTINKVSNNQQVDKQEIKSNLHTHANKMVLDLFKEDSQGNVYLDRNFYSTGNISAFGFEEGQDGGVIINVIDNLTSTSTTDALSANQGRYLKTLIDNIEVGEGGQVIVDWEAITGKPTTFAPSAHTHIIGDVTGLQGVLDGKASLSQLDDKEDKFTKNSAFNKNFGTGLNDVARGNHTHTFASLTSIPTTLSGYGITDAYTKTNVDDLLSNKADKATKITAGTGLTGGGTLASDRTLSVNFGTTAGTVTQGNDSRLSDARTPLAHSHAISGITGLQTALNSKLETSIFNTHNTDNVRHITGAERTKWDTVVTDFAGLEIGGRNLVRNSSFNGNDHWNGNAENDSEVKFSNNNTLKFQELDTATRVYSRIDSNSRYKAKQGDTFTLSFYVMTNDVESMSSIWLEKNPDSGYEPIGSLNIPEGTKNGEWVKVSVTYTINGDSTEAGLYIAKLNGTAPAFWISDIKIEKGTIPTDWTPAPEDQVSDWSTTDVTSFSYIKNKPTQLSQFADNIGVGTHIANKANPHSVTKAQVGLGNVDNTSDLLKPISNATQTALDLKLNKLTFDDLFEKVEISAGKWAVKVKYNLFSVGEISAFGASESEGGGSGLMSMMQDWNIPTGTENYYLPAKLAVPFYIDTIGRLSNLEGGSATTVNVSGTGDLLASVSKVGNNINFIKGNQSWGNLVGKPSTFTPSAHSHKTVDVTDVRGMNESGDYYLNLLPSEMPSTAVAPYFGYVQGLSGWHSILNVKGWTGSYATWQLIGCASTSSHDNLYLRVGYGDTWGSPLRIHHSGNLTSLSQLTDNIGVATHNNDNKRHITDVERTKWDGVVTDFEGHTHTFASLTSIPTTLSGYGITDGASKVHTHAISDITNLQTTLNNKLETSIFNTHNTDNVRHITGVERTKWDGVVTDFAGLEIGGRNYILNSLNRIGLYPNVPSRHPIENQSVAGMDYRRFRRTYPEGVTSSEISTYTAEFFTPEKSGDYIYSTYFRPSDFDIELRLRFGNTYGEYTLCKAGEWTRVSVVAFIDKGQNTRLFGVYGSMPQESVQWIDYNRVSVVSGNKATDWTPAPEDQVSDWSTTDVNSFSFIKNKPTSLSQFTDNIGVATHIANKANPHYVTTAQIGAVDLTTNQNIGGVKSFTSNAKFTTIEASGTLTALGGNSTNWNSAFTHISVKTNPHDVTKAQVGLGNVTNESKATMFTNPTFTGITTTYSLNVETYLEVIGESEFLGDVEIYGNLGVYGTTKTTILELNSNWKFVKVGNNIELQYNGVTKQIMTNNGDIIATAGMTAYQ